MSKLPSLLYRASQVRELDRTAIEDIGIPGICLMERAGTAAFELLKSQYPQARRLTILCGIGNNAGDGYVLARLAHLAGYHTIVLQIGDVTKLKGDALTAYEAMNQVGLHVQEFTDKKLKIVDVVVDALFGTGLDREIVGEWYKVIESINKCTCPVLSIDIPSGLHADTGNVLGIAVHAKVTISFIGLKQGMFTGFGADYCGKIYFHDLQVPPQIYKYVKSSTQRITYKNLKYLLVKRRRTAHKGDFGQVLIIGGEQGMTGAVRLAAKAATRVGAGLVSIATRTSHAALMNLTYPEIMTHGVETIQQLTPLMEKATIVAIGPGLGQSEWAVMMLQAVKEIKKPIIIDADALNLLAKAPFRLPNSILTPHPGEAARLLNISTKIVQQDRFSSIHNLQVRFGGVCVLKGAGTLITDASNQVNICAHGNPGMACGGMGDLLTGTIAGLVAQGFSNLDAANLGVCLHAKAGDRAAKKGERGLLASDLLPWLRHYANPK